jgi:glucose-6-phosphate 1-dehydrogenase
VRREDITETTTIVIFGASGDLTQRKLVPALFNLYRKERLPSGVHIVGMSRSPYSRDEFRGRLRDGVMEFAGNSFDPSVWDAFAEQIWYLPGDLTRRGDLESLQAFLNGLEGRPAHRLYYLATAPALYQPAVAGLGALDMAGETEGWRRLVIEKPFGNDLASAEALNWTIHAVFNESQVYRIDHYLGKETAQNILFFRFANAIFEPVWNRRYVDHVQVNVAETVDVEHRAAYYDQTGVLRDMVQNHLLQLMTLVAMEPPASFDADAVRNEKVKVLRSVRPIDLNDTVLGQYEGYRENRDVAPHSRTPTYAALKLYIDNWRWKGVPFFLRSGKALAGKISEVVIQFQRPPHLMFDLPSDYELTPNILAMCIQPGESIHLKFETKVPDSTQAMRSVEMQFQYRSYFGNGPLPDAYERLLLDALNGDASLFTRSDGIEAAWQLIDAVIEGWDSPEMPPPATYRRGSWGPIEADKLMAGGQRAWCAICTDNGGQSTVEEGYHVAI